MFPKGSWITALRVSGVNSMRRLFPAPMVSTMAVTAAYGVDVGDASLIPTYKGCECTVRRRLG
ncbi:MAG: hypothetical protein QF537_16425 [SAR324 cluster bacterium]|nr:hypothetical protein [SAR324 cluster bacterium]